MIMSTPSICTLLALLIVGPLARADRLTEAEDHLQAREYGLAAGKLAGIPADDRAAYLRATALFLDGNYAASEEVTTALIEGRPDSKWIAKARYLLARALIEQQKHQAAERIYATEAARIFSTTRKQGLAERLITFADKLSRDPDPDELGALPPDHAKALGLYR